MGEFPRMVDTPRSISQIHDLQRTARRVASDGVLWLVYELPPSRFDRRASPSLVFESDMTVRRVRNYPAGWRDLGDDELIALSWTV